MTKSFARTLAQLRRQAGLSQEQLAQRMDVSRQAVGKWEAGQSMPELDKLIALAELFGVSLDALVRGEAANGIDPDPAAAPCASGQPGQQVVYLLPGYEYKSRRSWHGLPLVHINLGYGRYGLGLRRAHGVIAIGNVATGIVAVGGFGLGVVSFSGIGLGLLSLGGIALGGLAAGWLAIGACALGCYTVGAAAVAARAAVGVAALARQASAGHNPDAGFVITAQTSAAQVAGYLRDACPGIAPLLAWLMSLFAL